MKAKIATRRGRNIMILLRKIYFVVDVWVYGIFIDREPLRLLVNSTKDILFNYWK